MRCAPRRPILTPSIKEGVHKLSVSALWLPKHSTIRYRNGMMTQNVLPSTALQTPIRAEKDKVHIERVFSAVQKHVLYASASMDFNGGFYDDRAEWLDKCIFGESRLFQNVTLDFQSNYSKDFSDEVCKQNKLSSLTSCYRLNIE